HGVWIILSYIFSEMYREYTADVTNFLWNFSTTLVPVLLYLVAGILLWRRSNALAGRMVSDEQTEGDQCRLPGREFMAIAFSIVGLVVLVHAIPRIASVLAYLVSQPPPDFQNRWTASTIAQLTALGVQVILGAVLFMSGWGLARLVMKIRTAGLNNKDQNQV
ncbi:MAG: hypothetical protein SVV80_12505, partial [Planctomycetota bacterium]|nr:hypothetical protein [Planctomycetota bacterium]